VEVVDRIQITLHIILQDRQVLGVKYIFIFNNIMKQHILKGLVLGLFLFAGPSVFAQKTLSIDSVFTVQVRLSNVGTNSWPSSKTYTVPSGKCWKIEQSNAYNPSCTNGNSNYYIDINGVNISPGDFLTSCEPWWLGSSDQITFSAGGNSCLTYNLSIIQFKLQ
jgi:hypothetical protein